MGSRATALIDDVKLANLMVVFVYCLKINSSWKTGFYSQLPTQRCLIQSSVVPAWGISPASAPLWVNQPHKMWDKEPFFTC